MITADEFNPCFDSLADYWSRKISKAMKQVWYEEFRNRRQGGFRGACERQKRSGKGWPTLAQMLEYYRFWCSDHPWEKEQKSEPCDWCAGRGEFIYKPGAAELNAEIARISAHPTYPSAYKPRAIRFVRAVYTHGARTGCGHCRNGNIPRADRETVPQVEARGGKYVSWDAIERGLPVQTGFAGLMPPQEREPGMEG